MDEGRSFIILWSALVCSFTTETMIQWELAKGSWGNQLYNFIPMHRNRLGSKCQIQITGAHTKDFLHLRTVLMGTVRQMAQRGGPTLTDNPDAWLGTMCRRIFSHIPNVSICEFQV